MKKTSLFLSLFLSMSVFAIHAAESLVVSYKVRSMYFDPDDKDVNQKKFSGTATNGVPDKDRWQDVRRQKEDYLKAYYGYTDPQDQPHGAIATAIWIERAKDGKFIKVLGRWCGNNGYNGKRTGYDISIGSLLFVQGETSGRAYDLFRFNGNYGRPYGNSWTQPPRAPGVKNLGMDPTKYSVNPNDGIGGDYDAVLGPTVGTKVKGSVYLHVDNPHTIEDDASVLSSVAVIPGRAAGQQPRAWDLRLAWNPENNKIEDVPLPPGDYNIVIEAIEWAMEYEYRSSLAKSDKNTKNSQMFYQQFDHIKTIGYTYDGKSWELRKKENADDHYASDTMSVALGKKVSSYQNYFTGNILKRGKNEAAVIYDINVDYVCP